MPESNENTGGDGRFTLGRYDIESPLGAGGTAGVFRAVDTHSGLPCALKILRMEESNAKTIERFQRESEAMLDIRHPNVIPVLDRGAADGWAYIVMPIVEGRTLHDVLADGALSWIRAARICRQVAAGLAAIHRLGLVHRDLKPGNIIVGAEPTEHVTIIDFGAVRPRNRINRERLTAHGHIVGTPLYMAPEQFLGGDIWPSCDLYALGAVLFEMVSGAPPFEGCTLQDILERHLTEPAPRLPPTAGLDVLANWMLAKQPRDRPDRAEVVVEELDRLLERAQPLQPLPRIDSASLSIPGVRRVQPPTDGDLVGPWIEIDTSDLDMPFEQPTVRRLRDREHLEYSRAFAITHVS